MQAKGYFISGTDTGVGKTSLTAALAMGFQAVGKSVAMMKPVQTGCEDGRAPDLELVYGLLGLDIPQAALPYAFEPACSPHLAAQLAKQTIKLSRITAAADQLATQADVVLIEGAGGIEVPLNARECMGDLMQALGRPVILATRPGLGTLNHTLLSLHRLRQLELDIAGYALVNTTPDPWTFIEEDNQATLLTRAEAPCLGTLPYVENFGCNPGTRSALCASGLQLIQALEH